MSANIDIGDLIAHKARVALDRIIERDQTHITFGKMDREDWREYGEQLFAKRQFTPSDAEYGAWIQENRLDRGPAAHQGTRSDSIWLFQNWTSLQELYTGNHHHPVAIRTDCKKAGYGWAGKTEYEKKRRAESRRARYSWARVAVEEKMLSPKVGGRESSILKVRIVERWPDIAPRNPLHEVRLREACRILKAERDAEDLTRQTAQREAEEQREARQQENAKRSELEAEYSRKHADLQTSFAAVVQTEIAARLPDAARREIADARAAAASARELEAVWRARMESCKKGVALVMENWRSIVGCLHPDRAPEDRREQFARASDVMLRVKDQFSKTEYGKW